MGDTPQFKLWSHCFLTKSASRNPPPFDCVGVSPWKGLWPSLQQPHAGHASSAWATPHIFPTSARCAQNLFPVAVPGKKPGTFWRCTSVQSHVPRPTHCKIARKLFFVNHSFAAPKLSLLDHLNPCSTRHTLPLSGGCFFCCNIKPIIHPTVYIWGMSCLATAPSRMQFFFGKHLHGIVFDCIQLHSTIHGRIRRVGQFLTSGQISRDCRCLVGYCWTRGG